VTCVSTTNSCPAATLSSGACSFSIPALAHNGSATVGDSTVGYTGSITATCNNGSLSSSGASCGQDCSAGSITPSGSSCTYNYGAIGHGGTGTANNVTGGFSGSGTAQCSNGSVSISGASCARTAPTAAWVTSSSSVQSTQNISISWGATGTVTNYLLRMSGPGVSGTLDRGTSTSYTGGAGASGFTNGTFNFWVTACNGSSCSAESAASTTQVTCSLPAPSTRESTVCDMGFTGTKFRDRTVTCNTTNGSVDWTLGAYGAWDTSGCQQAMAQSLWQGGSYQWTFSQRIGAVNLSPAVGPNGEACTNATGAGAASYYQMSTAEVNARVNNLPVIGTACSPVGQERGFVYCRMDSPRPGPNTLRDYTATTHWRKCGN
jgi:hypothetical protein